MYRFYDVGVETYPIGRPRDPRIDQALLQAALDELAQHGYEGLSLARVAELAGTSRQALYRRYPGKPELVAAAITRLAAEAPPPPELTGDWWYDLIALLDREADWFLRSGAGAALGPFLLRPEGDPLGAVARRVTRPRRRGCGPCCGPAWPPARCGQTSIST